MKYNNEFADANAEKVNALYDCKDKIFSLNIFAIGLVADCILFCDLSDRLKLKLMYLFAQGAISVDDVFRNIYDIED